MPDYKIAGRQLFKAMHSYAFDDRLDLYYATERENIPDSGLLEATGFTGSSSDWDVLVLPGLGMLGFQ
jgi:hypothetical protein